MDFKKAVETLLELALEVQVGNFQPECVTSEDIEDAIEVVQDYVEGFSDDQ
tara:strand:- start:934 stop:1086 length:153 start_codon:yes stop_codon:yes gene_type:complete